MIAVRSSFECNPGEHHSRPVSIHLINKIIMKYSFAFIGLIALLGCASSKSATGPKAGQGDTRTKPVELVNNTTFLLTDRATDKSYAFQASNPVKVGGSADSTGPANERRFLNALLGPNGEQVSYARAGSCCPFKTPNGLINNTGMLDRYRITWAGSKDTLDIFINMYDKGDLKIPFGLNAAK